MDINKLRNAFADKKPTGNFNTNNLQNDYYPFWNIPDGSQAIVRFLPDANSENPRGFMVEKRMHELTINGKTKKVPCNYMHGEKCPICEASKAFYAAGDKVNGKKYWRKVSYVAQALVLEDPIAPPSPLPEGWESPVGAVKLLSITHTLYNIIKDTFESGELETPPFFYEDGTNFVIKKDTQGDYPSYVLSKFSRRSDTLDPEVVEFVETQIKDLATVLPKQLGYDKLQAMLDADLNGTAYEDESTSRDDSASTSISARVQQALKPAPQVEEQHEVEASAPPVSSTPAPTAPSATQDATARGNSIVDQIKRKREAQQAAAAANQQ